MATFNGETFLPEQLSSLAGQSHCPHELIVCDDSSTDGSRALVEAFAETAPFPVQILRNDRNVGYADSFLRAARAGTGEWVAFCDQDDVWLPTKLARCAEVIGQYPQLVLLSHSAFQVDAELNHLPWKHPDHKSFRVSAPLHGPRIKSIPGFSLVFKGELLLGLPLSRRPPDLAAHDAVVYQLANIYGYTAWLPDALVLYRRHKEAATAEGVGKAAHMSIRTRLKMRLTGDPQSFERMAVRVCDYAAFCDLIRRECSRYAVDPGFARRTDEAIDYFRALGEGFRQRQKMYGKGTGSLQRARILRRLISSGSYWRIGQGVGMGLGGLTKDVIRAVAPF